MNSMKRSLSESSTGSEDANDDYGGFKKPRSSQVPFYERRESQASTASSTSFSLSEAEDHDADVQRLNQALDSTSEEEETPVTPSPKIESSNYSSFAQKMMAKMGYQSGKGLGSKGQGIVEPVTASNQRGRRGLGHILKGLEDEKVDWDPDSEVVDVEEKVEWLPPITEPVPSMNELRSWMREGPRKENIEDETQFCNPEILKSIIKSKSIFDQLEGHEMRKARTKSNPFEIIQGVFFLNRAAMKMANMDAVFDFMFTNPKDKSGNEILKENSLLYFADVCAGPGGFSEYVLWRKRWKAKGFGFTIKGKNDFKLEDFYAGTPESFEPHYGEGGRDGDGDVFKEANIKEFTNFVLQNTDGLGVHFMMADGGFSVEGQENIQEILSKQLYLCQCLVALSIVRTGGHFVCKLFDLFTPFSIGLIYLMYRAFDQVCIHKPNTSRPANSERYIICKGKRHDAKEIKDYMYEINCRLNTLGFSLLGTTQSSTDVIEIVPSNVIFEDEKFVDYMRRSNDAIGERQIVSLVKIRAFHQNPALTEDRQREIRDQCLYNWKVPNDVRKAPAFEEPHQTIPKMLGPSSKSVLEAPSTTLTPANLENSIKSILDWKCIPLGGKAQDCTFYLGLGRSKNYFYNRSSNRWQRVNEKFDLPAQTLIYAEAVQECRGEAKGMRKCPSLHVIDAVYVAGEDWRNHDLKTRNEMLKVLVKAMAKPSLPDHLPMRVKEIFGLENLEAHFLSRLTTRLLKGTNGPRLTIDVDEEKLNDRIIKRYFMPTGLLMLPIVKEPYMMAFSRSQKRKYWYNYMTKESVFECPVNAVMDFPTSFSKRLLWNWDEGVQLYPEQDVQRNNKKVHSDTLLDFCRQKLGK